MASHGFKVMQDCVHPQYHDIFLQMEVTWTESCTSWQEGVGVLG